MYVVSDYILNRPNWADSVKYRRKWQTNIQISLSGEEQRSALLTWPRRSLSFSILSLDYSKISMLKKVLYKNLYNLLGVPFWQDGTVLTAKANSGQKTLNVQSVLSRNFEPGGLCILIASDTSYEDAIIGSILGNQITLQDNLAHTWPVRTEVYPVMISRVRSTQQIDMITSLYGKISADADEDYYAGITRHIGEVDGSFVFYRGSPIFNVRPNWASEINYKLYHPYDLLSFLGETFSMTHYDETAVGLKASYLETSKLSIQKVIDFFDSRRGRWGNCWVPTWQRDLIINAPFLATDNILSVQSIDLESYWLGTAAGSYIIVFWPDWTYAVGRIIDTTETTITIESTIGKSCSAGQLRRLLTCFLLSSRFDQDEIEVEYLTSEIGNIGLSYRSLFGENRGVES